MHDARKLMAFERKNSTVILTANGSGYVITTAQRIRMDLVWMTTSVRTNINEAVAKFNEHKANIQSRRHCIGDDSRLR